MSSDSAATRRIYQDSPHPRITLPNLDLSGPIVEAIGRYDHGMGVMWRRRREVMEQIKIRLAELDRIEKKNKEIDDGMYWTGL